MPIAGRGFAFQLPIPVQSWLGGSRQSGQNFPPLQRWQVKTRAISLPHLSQRAVTVVMDAHKKRILLSADPGGGQGREPEQNSVYSPLHLHKRQYARMGKCYHGKSEECQNEKPGRDDALDRTLTERRVVQVLPGPGL